MIIDFTSECHSETRKGYIMVKIPEEVKIAIDKTTDNLIHLTGVDKGCID